uniref:SET domain-containing protein n=1 Tax=Mesocestoides corti TaxID=53468 RepID=A0A5K3FB46_MESCO
MESDDYSSWRRQLADHSFLIRNGYTDKTDFHGRAVTPHVATTYHQRCVISAACPPKPILRSFDTTPVLSASSTLVPRGEVSEQRVCEYRGSHIEPRLVRNLAVEQQARWGHAYAMLVHENLASDFRIIFETAVDGADGVVDAQTQLPPSCLINHSCNPNLTVIPVRINSLEPHLVLFAIRDIEVDEELTYDYEDKSCEASAPTGKPCLCGARRCRLYLPFYV